METKLPIIASLTTTPERIHKLYKTLKSIARQSTPPTRIVVNIPYIFEKTGEVYSIPRFFEEFPTIYVNWVKKDYGPVTKLLPVLSLIEGDAYIWLVDDDQEYLRGEISYMVERAESNKIDTVYSLAGLNMINGTPIFSHSKGPIDIFEAYSGVLLKKSMFSDDFYDYIDKCISNPSCKISDDMFVSMYLQSKGYPIEKIGSFTVNLWLHWTLGCVLEHGEGPDALHNSGNEPAILRYKRVYPFIMNIINNMQTSKE